MPKKRAYATFAVYIPKERGGSELLKKLRARAKKEGKSLSALALEALLSYLEKEEKPRRRGRKKTS